MIEGNETAPRGMNESPTGTSIDAGLTQACSGFDLPAIRKLLGTREGPLIDILRRQLSNYERGDAESRAALKPMILASVERIEHRNKARA